jgi:DNA invertase Pin-like site-specific DNA recombinase
LIAVDSPASFLDETRTAVLIRQVFGAVSQFEKAALVAKLKAPASAKAATGKCGGRYSVAESSPQTVAIAKKLARYPVHGQKRSLRDVAAGYVTGAGTRYGAAAVARMIC